MAVQAQYPSNILLFNRNVQESKNNVLGANDYSLENNQPGGGYLEQSHMFFNNNNNNNGVGINPRKRSREIATTATHTTTTTVNSFNFSLQNHELQQQQQQQHQSHQFIDLSLLQNRQQQQQQHQSVVSTGLKLSFGDQNIQQKQQQIQQNPAFLSLFSDELALQFKQQSDELNYFLHTQGEQLRRTLAEKRQRHYHALLGAAEEAVSRHVREKEAELESITRRNADLEARAAQLTAEAQAWQARARAQEAQAVSLQAQIQQAMVGPGLGPSNIGGTMQQDREGSGLQCAGDAEDAESVYIDPVSERRGNPPRCKACRTRVASVVLLPCRHMCVCVQCDNVIQACPVCCSLRSASVEVYLS